MKSPLFILIETTADLCSVAISDDKGILAASKSLLKYDHASKLTLLIEQARQMAGIALKDVSAISISLGPGSYTGLRVGMSTAQALAMSLSIPLIGIPTLEAIAFKCASKHNFKPGKYIPMIDARRMEVYTMTFNEKMQAIGDAKALILDEDSIQTEIGQSDFVCFSGNGAFKVKSFLEVKEHVLIDIEELSASDLHGLTLHNYQQKKFLNIFLAQPIYIKQPNITTPKPRLKA